MHEHAITNAVVHQIIHACEDSGIKNPKRITVQLGALTTYKKEAIEFYFQKIRPDFVLLNDASLCIIEIPGRIFCNSCGKASEIGKNHVAGSGDELFIPCPICSSIDVQVLSGKDVIIKEITG